MLGLLEIVIPVFLVVLAGYGSVRLKYVTDAQIDALTFFAQGIAIPCLLFRASSEINLGEDVSIGLLASFYIPATICFIMSILIALKLFKRRPGEAVAIGFGGFFSNSVMLGLPIMERAYGEAALAPNYAIVALHAPYCYGIGITVMEILRADGRGALETAQVVAKAIFKNALMIGIILGFALNVSGLRLPDVVDASLSMVIAAALPTALFGLGGVLTRYRVQDSIPEATATTFISLIVHPTLAFLLCKWFGLSLEFTRAAVLTASMAPGINTYIFAAMYQRGMGAAASTIIIATLASLVTVSGWLWVLG
jgi:predicted permease